MLRRGFVKVADDSLPQMLRQYNVQSKVETRLRYLLSWLTLDAGSSSRNLLLIRVLCKNYRSVWVL